MATAMEETPRDWRLRLSLLMAFLFFANPIALTLANLWERVISDPLAAFLFLQLEGVYALSSLAAGWAIRRQRPVVWLWLVPVILAAALLGAQVAFTLSQRLNAGPP